MIDVLGMAEGSEVISAAHKRSLTVWGPKVALLPDANDIHRREWGGNHSPIHICAGTLAGSRCREILSARRSKVSGPGCSLFFGTAVLHMLDVESVETRVNQSAWRRSTEIVAISRGRSLLTISFSAFVMATLLPVPDAGRISAMKQVSPA